MFRFTSDRARLWARWFLVPLLAGVLLVPEWTTGQALPPGATLVPAALRSLASLNYPVTPRRRPKIRPPIAEQYSTGVILYYEHSLSAPGPSLGVVTYAGFLGLIVRKNSDGTYTKLWGMPQELDHTTCEVGWKDVDGDGVDEIAITVSLGLGSSRIMRAVLVFKYQGGNLVAITPLSTDAEIPNALLVPDPFTSNTGVQLIDVDGDGKDELVTSPSIFDKPVTDETVQETEYTDGSRVFKIVGGVYTLQLETPVGTPAVPPIDAAVKPASFAVSELHVARARARALRARDAETIKLYFPPPAGHQLNDVDWSTARVGDFQIAPTGDLGSSGPPAGDPNWTPFGALSQPMLMEDVPPAGLSFDMTDSDPTIYFSPLTKLHPTTPFRTLLFPKTPVLSFLNDQFSVVSSKSPIQSCISAGAGQRCFTHVNLPLRAALTTGGFLAQGNAHVWIETTIGGPPPTSTPTPTPTPTSTMTPTPSPTPTLTPTPGAVTNTPTITATPAATGFHTLIPCRVIDTRGPAGPYGAPSLIAGTDRTFIFGGQCGIPPTALAVALNVVAVNPATGPGFLTLFPGGTTLPLAATINYNAGNIRANNAIIPLGTLKDIAVHCGQGFGTVDLVIDVNGYFE